MMMHLSFVLLVLTTSTVIVVAALFVATAWFVIMVAMMLVATAWFVIVVVVMLVATAWSMIVVSVVLFATAWSAMVWTLLFTTAWIQSRMVVTTMWAVMRISLYHFPFFTALQIFIHLVTPFFLFHKTVQFNTSTVSFVFAV